MKLTPPLTWTTSRLLTVAALAITVAATGTACGKDDNNTTKTATTVGTTIAPVPSGQPQYGNPPPFGQETTVSGSARVRYLYAGPGDDIRFTFTGVHGNPFPKQMHGNASGTITWHHDMGINPRTGKRSQGGGEATVDCVLPGGNTVTLTAIVTKPSPGVATIGSRLGFSVTTGGPGTGRVGFSWGAMDPHGLPRCAGPAPFAAVIDGNLTIGGGGELPPTPTTPGH